MSNSTTPPRKGGVAWPAFLICVVVGAIGLAFDLSQQAQPAFWIGALSGARALIGAGAMASAMLVAHIVRLALGRRDDAKGGSDVRDHA